MIMNNELNRQKDFKDLKVFIKLFLFYLLNNVLHKAAKYSPLGQIHKC